MSIDLLQRAVAEGDDDLARWLERLHDDGYSLADLAQEVRRLRCSPAPRGVSMKMEVCEMLTPPAFTRWDGKQIPLYSAEWMTAAASAKSMLRKWVQHAGEVNPLSSYSPNNSRQHGA